MAEDSGIGWTDHTMNFWWGCNKVSPECGHCYIGGIMRRAGKEPFLGPMRTNSTWGDPQRWDRRASEAGQRLRVFTCSMSDFFHPGADPWRGEAWDLIRRCMNLDWLILTKRPELIPDRLPPDWGRGFPNVWLGVTCGVRASLDRLVKLKTIPAAIRFVSAEPLLERIDFGPHIDGIDWIITGCEQAGVKKRRPMDLDWVRDIDRQCREVGVAHFFKQRYEGTQLVYDGTLDGEVRQVWPSGQRRAQAGVEDLGENALRPPGRESKFVTLSELTPAATQWLWSPRIPRGELTVLDGDPSVNKSTLVVDLAARVSTGREMPGGAAGAEGGALLLLGEDSIRKTVIHRLKAAGADLDRITVASGQVAVPQDLPEMEAEVRRIMAVLVVIDPLIAFLGCDANSDRQVRLAMTPLKAFAERTNCAVVLVRHLTKRGGRHAMYRGGGSIGIVAATRSALLVGRSPDDPDLRVLCHVKSNLGPLAPSLSFGPVATPEGVVKIEWRGECDYTPDDLLAPAKPGENQLDKAMVFLKELLSGGPVEQKVVKSKAVEAGLAYRTVERAKELLGVRSERHGWGPGSKCRWSTPTEGP